MNQALIKKPSKECQLADDGDAFIQYRIGMKYRRGEWGGKDYSKAAKLLKSAAEKGYAAAQVAFGDMLSNGEGLKKDDHEAFEWYQRAARQNDENGKLLMGMAYEQGKGMKKDLVKAYAWFSSLSNTKGIGSIDTIWQSLNTEERAKAMKETREIKDMLANSTCN